MIEEIEINNLDEMSLFVRKYRPKLSGVADLLELIQLAKTRSESILLSSHLFIYALTNNKALNRLIQKVGFKKSLSYQLR